MDWIYIFFILTSLGKHSYGLLQTVQKNNTEKMKLLKLALDYVDRLNASSCTNGTSDTLALRLDRTVWDVYAYVALNTANYISKYLQIKSPNGSLSNSNNSFIHTNMFGKNYEPFHNPQGDCSKLSKGVNKGIKSGINTNLTDDLIMIYVLVQNNIGKSSNIILGSALAFEPYVLPGFAKFSPYAYRTTSGCVTVEDLALNYNYLDSSVQWYFSIKTGLNSRNIQRQQVKYGELLKDSTNPTLSTYAVATLADGFWTNPYFDCGGGNIWMVTFSAPIFWINPKGKLYFRGVATIDIELTNIDINQCDLEDNNDGGSYNSETNEENNENKAKKIADIFRGTHSCQETTKCVHVSKCGFRRGCYICICEDGYYFPYKNQEQYFNGSDVEAFYSLNHRNLSNELHSFKCLRCARYCDTCIDSSPCMHQSNVAVRVIILVLTACTLLCLVALSAIVCYKRSQMVFKTASPIFLFLMCLGGIIMTFEEFILYFEPSDLICLIIIWPRHIGFAILYGSLILKTWRISIIFKQGKVKRVYLPDTALLQRMVPVLVVFIGGLIASNFTWSPTIEIITSSSLKYLTCSTTIWFYTFNSAAKVPITGYALIAESLMLLYGVYLCFTVRKAPAYFNESRYITWSTYNTLILGTFLNIFQAYVKPSIGPDIMYFLQFLSLQIKATITVAFILIPKLYVLYKMRSGKNVEIDEIHTVTGRLIRQNAAAYNLQEKSAQTDEVSINDICNCVHPVEKDNVSNYSQQWSNNSDSSNKSKHSYRKDKHHKKSLRTNKVEPKLSTDLVDDDLKQENKIV